MASPVFLPSTSDLNTGIGPVAAGFTRVTVARDPHTVWTEWRKTTSLWPRRSITEKMIIGSIYKRGRTYNGPHGNYRERQFATNKELFTEKLKGKA